MAVVFFTNSHAVQPDAPGSFEILLDDVRPATRILSAGFYLQHDSLRVLRIAPMSDGGIGVPGAVIGWSMVVWNDDTVAHDATLYVTAE